MQIAPDRHLGNADLRRDLGNRRRGSLFQQTQHLFLPRARGVFLRNLGNWRWFQGVVKSEQTVASTLHETNTSAATGQR